MPKKPKVPVYDRLPNAYEHANRTVYLPPSKALGSFRDLNREEPGFWGSDGERWHLLAAEEQIPVTVPPATDGTTFITNINNVKITHGHRWRIFNGDTITAKDYYQYIIVDNIIVDEGAEIIVEEFGDFIVLGDRFGEGAAADVEVKVGKTLFVDVVYGDDGTAERENFILPYATGPAAQVDAQSGDTIVFRSGTHTISSPLGKDGVNYHIQLDARLAGTSGVDVFFGSGISFRIINEGVISSTNGNLINITNSSTVVVHSSGRVWFSNRTGIRAASNSTMYGYWNFVLGLSADSIAFDATSSNCIMYAHFNYVEAKSRIVTAAGGSIFIGEGNYFKCTTGGRNDEGVLRAQEGGVLRMKTNLCDVAMGSTVITGFIHAQQEATGGTIYFEGTCNYTGSGTPPVILREGQGSEVYLQNARIVYNNSSASKPIVDFEVNNTSKIFHCKDVELINHNTAAGAHGILANFTSGAGSSNIDMQNTIIRLNSTAVGAGAKALSSSAAPNYRAFTDVLSNGAWDGTNLVGVTSALTDAEIKSD